jgi:hypothetical protein
MTCLRGTIHVSPPACDPFSNAGVSYSVHGILSRSLNAVIVMQMVICHSQSWEKSALLVTDQPRSRHCSACRRLHRPKGAHRDPSRPQISPEQGTQCTLSSATATVGSNRSFSSQVSPDRSIECMSPSPPAEGSSPRSFPRRVMPRRSQAAAGHVVVRHFFHWPGHIA